MSIGKHRPQRASPLPPPHPSPRRRCGRAESPRCCRSLPPVSSPPVSSPPVSSHLAASVPQRTKVGVGVGGGGGRGLGDSRGNMLQEMVFEDPIGQLGYFKPLTANPSPKNCGARSQWIRGYNTQALLVCARSV